MRAIADARDVYVEESVNRYVVALLRHTRGDARLALGASPRAGIALLRVAKARALADGRDYVLPDDVKALAVPVLAHRLILAPEARSAGVTPRTRSATRSRARPSRSELPAAAALTLALAVATSYAAAWLLGARALYPRRDRARAGGGARRWRSGSRLAAAAGRG